MKKFWLGLLVAILVMGLALGMTACNGGTDATESVSASESASETGSGTESESGEGETPTESETDSETASETDSETVSETASETETESETEDRSVGSYIDRITADAEAHEELPVIGFNLGSVSDYAVAFELMLDAGINGLVTGYEFAGAGTHLGPVFDAAMETGMKLMISCNCCTLDTSVASVLNKTKLLLSGENAEEYQDLILGLYLQDEPIPPLYAHLADVASAVYENVPESANWLVGANLLPWGPQGLKYPEYDLSFANYWETIDYYASLVHPTVMMFDRYPWENDPTVQYYFRDLLTIKSVADAYDIPFYSYIQLYEADMPRYPTYQELRYETHLTLATGCKGILLFHMPNIFKDDVKTSTYYPVVKAVMSEIHGMNAVYLDFDTESMMLMNEDLLDQHLGNPAHGYRKAVCEDAHAATYLNDTGAYRQVTGVETDGAFVIGCMYNESAGTTGLYLVNADYNDADSIEITVSLDGEYTYQIWGMDGLLRVGYGDAVTLAIDGSEGQFVVIDPTVDLDWVAYSGS